MLVGEGAQGLGEPPLRQVDGHREAYGSRYLVQAAQLGLRLHEPVDRPLAMRHVPASLVGEREAARRPVQQPDVQSLFQGAHAGADRRAGHGKPPARAGEAARLRYLKKRLDLRQTEH